MALERVGQNNSNGVAFLVAGGIVFEIIAACCSSPQTTELNADKRAQTLMKWVFIGDGLAAVFIICAALFDPAHAGAIIFGGLLAMGAMTGLYVYGKRCGLASMEPGTED
jgi:hypothetical protein